MFSDRAESLNRHARAIEPHVAEAFGHLGGDRNAETGRADLVKRDAPQNSGRPTARPIWSSTQPMQVSLVPMSGPGI